MWTIRYPSRRKCMPSIIDDRSRSVRIVGVARDQYLEIVRQANETAIEHPMRGARKSDAIANDVGPVCLDWSYVSGCDLCTAHPIDEL